MENKNNKKNLKQHLFKKRAENSRRPARVLVFGTFDLLHDGHINFFNQARKHGSFLIAVVARDITVLEVKGRRPIEQESVRLKNVQKHVDLVVLGKTGDKYDVISELKPDVICLGYDQFHFTDRLEDELSVRKLNAMIIRLLPYKHGEFKSTILRASRDK